MGSFHNAGQGVAAMGAAMGFRLICYLSKEAELRFESLEVRTGMVLTLEPCGKPGEIGDVLGT